MSELPNPTNTMEYDQPQTPEGITQFMSQSSSEDDWNNRCDAIKKSFGDYPSYWYSTIVLSGKMAAILKDKPKQ